MSIVALRRRVPSDARFRGGAGQRVWRYSSDELRWFVAINCRESMGLGADGGFRPASLRGAAGERCAL